jgi:hypothetical protein
MTIFALRLKDAALAGFLVRSRGGFRDVQDLDPPVETTQSRRRKARAEREITALR